jgi:exopolysaccharide biosynthesis polyprenyl glycosylphosphotransferase
MLQTHFRAFANLIALCDLAVIVTAVVLGSNLALPWFGLMPLETDPSSINLLVQSGLAVLGWLVIAWRLEFYQSRRTEGLSREVRALAEALLFGMGTAALVSLSVFDSLAYHPLFTFLVAFFGICMLRALVRGLLRTLRNHGRNFRRVVIVGHGRAAHELAQRLRASPHFGIRAIGSLRFGHGDALPLGDLPCLGSVDDLKSVLSEHQTDSLIVCPAIHARAAEIQAVFDACREAGIECYFAPDFFSMHNQGSSVVWFGDLPALKFHSGGAGPFRAGLKRTMDLLGAVLGLLLGAPVMAVCAIGIKLHDGGPVLFRQRRVGKDGQEFDCYKFRSMCCDADAQKHTLAGMNEAEGPVFKIRRDPRITPIGRVLRKYSLDELPQLFNVLVGDMSLVGPRPPVPAEVARYEWWQRRRISVRPGLTCVWQVWGRNKVSFRRWVEMDLYYIDNWGLWLDVKLILHTFRSVMSGTGM